MWAGALAGCYVRIRAQEKTISARYFMLLAWLPVVTMGYMLMATSWTGLAIVLAGGLSYTGGVWFLVNDYRHPYFHAVWHLSTICGTGLHFLFTYWYVATPTLG
jgi:hemolysin III